MHKLKTAAVWFANHRILCHDCGANTSENTSELLLNTVQLGLLYIN